MALFYTQLAGSGSWRNSQVDAESPGKILNLTTTNLQEVRIMQPRSAGNRDERLEPVNWKRGDRVSRFLPSLHRRQLRHIEFFAGLRGMPATESTFRVPFLIPIRRPLPVFLSLRK